MKMPPKPAAFQNLQLLAFFVLAFLICNTAAGLAGGLTGCLALAAAAVLCAVAQIAGLNGLNMFHDMLLCEICIRYMHYYSTGCRRCQVSCANRRPCAAQNFSPAAHPFICWTTRKLSLDNFITRVFENIQRLLIIFLFYQHIVRVIG